MCVKLSLKGLNSGSYPSHPTSIYTCGVIIVPKMCDGKRHLLRTQLYIIPSTSHLNFPINFTSNSHPKIVSNY